MKNSKGTEKAQAKVNGQGEVRIEEEDRATLPTAGWRGQWGTVLSTAYPGIGWTLSAMGDSAELYLEGQHYQTCFKKKSLILLQVENRLHVQASLGRRGMVRSYVKIT